MKTRNELSRVLSEAELDDVRGGQAFQRTLSDTHERVKHLAESIDRLAVLDFSAFQVPEQRSPVGPLGSELAAAWDAPQGRVLELGPSW